MTPETPWQPWWRVADPADLTISGGGGSVAVGTDALFAAAAVLRIVGNELAISLNEISAIDRLVTSGQLSAVGGLAGAMRAERAIDTAARLIARGRLSCALLGTALERSADGYGIAEATARRLAEQTAARAGYAIGLLLPGFLLAAAPVLLGMAGVAGLVSLTMPGPRRAATEQEFRSWLQRNSSVLSDPQFVTLMRLAVKSVDDIGAGLLRLPPGLNGAFGPSDVAASAGVVVGAGRAFGYLGETPVGTVATSRVPGGSIPSGWADRAGRVPQGDSQVRIDRYTVPGQPDRFEVYVSGTRDFALGHDSQPWDMTSNLNGIAGGNPGSVRSVEQAMAGAGITADSPVLFTGHSQGGLAAAIIAGSGKYNVQGLYTLGTPAAQATVPATVPWIALEHTNDIVPALSGSWAHSDPVLVRRELYRDAPAETDKFFPSHQLSAYESTAAMLDRSAEPRVSTVERRFARFTAGAIPAESTTWESTRVLSAAGH